VPESYVVGQDVEAYFFGRWKPARVIFVGHSRITVEVFLPAGLKPRRRATLKPARVRPRVRPEEEP